MLTIILAVIFCAAISVLVSTIITCKVSERIFRGALEFFEKIIQADEQNKQ